MFAGLPVREPGYQTWSGQGLCVMNIRVFSALAIITMLTLSGIATVQAASPSITGFVIPGAIQSGHSAIISYTLANTVSGNVEIIINGSGGDTVWTTTLSDQASGIYTVTWDGTYNNGTFVPDGQYSITQTLVTENPEGFFLSVSSSELVYVDNVDPTVTCDLEAYQYFDPDWYNSTVNVTLTPEDVGGSGVSSTVYSFDNATWEQYSGKFSVTEEGIHTLFWNCTDFAGNSALGNETIRIDKTPPVIGTPINVTLSAYGWYNQTVIMNFTPVDELSGLQVEGDFYWICDQEGVYMWMWILSDNAGNQAMRTETAYIDKTAPVTSHNLTGTSHLGSYVTDVVVNLTAEDNAPYLPSEVDYTEYRVNNGAWTRYSGNFTLGSSCTVYYRSVDKAGNFEEEQNFSIKRQIHIPWSEGSWWGKSVTIIQTATPTPTPTPAVSPTVVVTPMPVGTITPTSEATPAISPTPTATTPAQPQSPGTIVWIVLIGVIALVVVAGAYFLFFRK